MSKPPTKCSIPAPATEHSPPQRPAEVCSLRLSHEGLCSWEVCGEGATGDPFCDVECQRERGHDGKHRAEWF